jgi:tRNA-dihydrouridine synthase B
MVFAMHPFRIRDIVVDPPLLLAPMAGYTSSPLRRIAREFGCGMVFSEVIAVRGLLHRNRRSDELLAFEPSERPIGLQLLSGEPKEIAAAIPHVERAKPDAIDINLGCPKPKVVRKCEGGALLEKPFHAFEVVKAACAVATVPVMVKLRIPEEFELSRFIDLCLDFVDAGVAAITLHPRRVSDGFRGQARWELFAEVSPRIPVPLIGSGDVKTAGDARRLFEAGCVGVMIGRAAIGNPGIFDQIRRELAGLPATPPTAADRLSVCLRHLDMLREAKGDIPAIFEIRKQLSRYAKALPGVQSMVRRIITIADFDELRGALAEILATVSDT